VFAVLFDRFGPPEVLHVGEVDEPHAGAGEVRVRVRSAGVSPVDAGVRAGSPMARERVLFPHVPGVDAAGVVDELGLNVTGTAVGDEVFGAVDVARLGGATAQFAVLRFWAPKPVALSWAEAGAAGTSIETATRVLDLLDVDAGSTLLVDGAAGGVGSVLAQLAVARGVGVIGSCRPDSADFVSALGALPVAYGAGLTERVRELRGGVDAAADVAGAGSLEDLIALTGSADRVVTIADFKASALGVRLSLGRLGGQAGGEHGLFTAAALANEGRFRIPIREEFPVSEAALAHAAVEAGPQRGKIAIDTTWAPNELRPIEA
jgi:NADPH:quinone reductase-like Zn-dependent oxidoreductase